MLIHVYTGIKVNFVKEYHPTGRHETTMVKTIDGRFFYAPSIEFETKTGI